MPQPSGQPATQTHYTSSSWLPTPGQGGDGDHRPSTLLHPPALLLAAQPGPTVLTHTHTHTHFGLARWGLGLGGLGRWKEGGEEGVWAQLNPFLHNQEVLRVQGLGVGPSLGLAVGGGDKGGAMAQAWGGSRHRRQWAISGRYCSTCRVQLEKPNRECSLDEASARTASGSAAESVGE